MESPGSSRSATQAAASRNHVLGAPPELHAMVEPERLALLEARMNPTLPSPQNSRSSSAVVASGTDVVDVPDVSREPLSMFPTSTTSSPSRPASGKLGRFSKQEDRLLLECVVTHGKNWTTIASQGGLNRTAEQLRSRYVRIQRKRKRSGDTVANATVANATVADVVVVVEDDATAATADVVTEGTDGNQRPQSRAKTSPASSTVSPSTPTTTTTSTTSSTATASITSTPTTPSKVPIAPIFTAASSPRKSSAVRDLEAREAEVASKREWMERRERELQERETQLLRQEEKLRQEAKEREDALREVLAKVVREQARTAAEANAAKVAQMSLRLGTISYERHGHSVEEVWKDGSECADIQARLQQLDAQKEQLLRKRKVLKRLKASSSTDVAAAEIAEKEEILRLQLASVKVNKLNAERDLEELQSRIALHQRELRRVADQNASRFNTFPTFQDRYLLTHLLGKGGFSEVYKAFDLVELRYVACKIHQLNPLWTNSKKHNYTRHAIREYDIHKALQHERIVQLLDVFEIDENSFCTVLEFCEGQDLDFVLKTLSSHRMPEKEAKSIIVQVLRALEYLNRLEKPIIHYDLKPANILLNCGEVKITDFGLSKIMEDSHHTSMELTSQGAGTLWYLPPECFDVSQTPRISSKVDVWSVGVIFYQMLFGEKPFGHGMSQQSIMAENIISIRSRVQFPDTKGRDKSVSMEARAFIRACLNPNASNRPDILAILRHPYVAHTAPRFKEPAPKGHK